MRPEDCQRIAVTEVAEILNVNKSSASRLLQTLSSYGYVERDGDSRAYVLGPKMQNASQPGRKTVFRDLARPFLYQLMKLSGECAHTAIVAQGQALIIDDVESASSLRVSGSIGRIEHLHCTAVGKCLLAFLELPLPKNLPQLTPRTFSNHGALKLHLKEIKKQGYALDDEENTEGVRCLAAPVYDASDAAIACIGISGPTVRMTLESLPKYIKMILESSKELSISLGYKGNIPALAKR